MVDGKPMYPEIPIGEALANLDILGIEALLVLGGEGTLAIAEQFHKRGFPVIGIPKTIDNDLAATELTFGFMTAIDIATEALDRLHTTAASHDRVMILEVMGRNTGWIATRGSGTDSRIGVGRDRGRASGMRIWSVSRRRTSQTSSSARPA